MNTDIEYVLVPDLPKLGWLAKIDASNNICVWHGPSVECRPQWMVEGVWNEDFEAGCFHTSRVFFGSGIRLSDDKIFISTSCSNNARIFYCTLHDNIIASNSLVLMLGYTNATLDESHDYKSEATSVLRGSKTYDRRFRVKHPHIDMFYQVFYENIVISKGSVSFESRLRFSQFDSYSTYLQQLYEALNGLRLNYESTKRRHRISPITMISSGYDSTAVTCMVKNINVETCYTCKKADSVFPTLFDRGNDDGSAAATLLGMRIRYLDPVSQHIRELDELFLLASRAHSAAGAVVNEAMSFRMAEDVESMCEAAVVFRGDHGDTVWDSTVSKERLIDDIARHTSSEMVLMELRLKSGFILVSVPHIFAENIRQIHVITLSEEMKRWRTFDSYDRPIPRRIAEEAGIERGTFARRKKAMASAYRYPHNRGLRKEFRQYLRNKYGKGLCFICLYLTLNGAATFLNKLISLILRIRIRDPRPIWFAREFNMAFVMWIWATGVLSAKYRKVFDQVAQERLVEESISKRVG